jgi:phosphotriesterase-related protein
LTLPGVGRDPEWLARISRASGLNIVMGGGWYRDAYYPVEALIDRRSVDDLADELVREATVGVGDSGVRIGIIGEIGTDKPWLSAREERVHRAAARAARRTGLSITTHAVQSAVGLDQLTVFEEEGADLSRVVIGHADSNPSPAYHQAIVERGATVEFDFLGMSFTPMERHGEGRIVESICELLGQGRAGQIMLSQDVCHDSQLTRYGGNGYVHLGETFLPRLRTAGVGDDEIRTMTVDNPRRLLTIG